MTDYAAECFVIFTMASVGGFEELDTLFNKACSYVQTFASQFKSEQLLYFYSRYKQVNDGPCCCPRPGFFDFQGKQKWDAWNGLGKMRKEDAQDDYIKKVSQIDPDWETKVDSGQVKASGSLGIGVSTMQQPDDDEVADEDKTVFDWCIESNVKQVTCCLKSDAELVNELDSQGMALLHWASDRGSDEMVQLLIKMGADTNIQDEDGQTPLHYAVSCEHVSVVKTLLGCGANKTSLDHSGVSCADIAETTELQNILSNS